MKTRISILTLCGCLLPTIWGCETNSDTGSEKDPPIPVADSDSQDLSADDSSAADGTSSSDVAREKQFTGISFTIPAGWNELELTEMQRSVIEAKYEIPTGSGVVQLTLTSAGGGVEANIDRWIGQVQMPPGETPKRESVTIDGVETQWVDVRGAFNSGFGASVQSNVNWRLVGVGIPLQPRDFYLKLVGPREAVAAIAEDFREFARSANISG